ncbi:hypothetical protein JCM10207_008690 [Rhodosporidiobolus poonsookiae]
MSESSVAVVLLHGEGDQFNASLISQAYDGGYRTAGELHRLVKKELGGKESETVVFLVSFDASSRDPLAHARPSGLAPAGCLIHATRDAKTVSVKHMVNFEMVEELAKEILAVMPAWESYSALAFASSARAQVALLTLGSGQAGFADSALAAKAAGYYDQAAELMPDERHYKEEHCVSKPTAEHTPREFVELQFASLASLHLDRLTNATLKPVPTVNLRGVTPRRFDPGAVLRREGLWDGREGDIPLGDAVALGEA